MPPLLRPGADSGRPAVNGPMRRLSRLALVTALVALVAAPCAAVQPDSFSGVERIVAVGDVHGGYDEFVAILRAARVIDTRNRWSGGRTHLVQTGDLVDRGPGSRKVMDLMMRLETQALAAGGRVHALLGNHEVMNLTGDLRYTSAAEFAAFATTRSADVRDRAYARLADPARRDEPAYREQWQKEHPLGWVEHRQAFGPGGRYGAWIRQHHAVVKINGFLFLHGGIGPSVSARTLRDINQSVRDEIQQRDVPTEGLAVGRAGPLWYRGLAQGAEDELRSHVDRVLADYGVAHIVVGHTTTPGAVVPRFGGKVLLIDVGLSQYYGAHPACLVVQRGTAFALHRGRLLPLPVDERASVVAYLRSAAALDPQPSPLVPLIEAGGRLPIGTGAPEKRWEEGEISTKSLKSLAEGESAYLSSGLVQRLPLTHYFIR